MSAREAYIAARSGAPKSSRPAAGTSKPDGPPGSPTREQKAFDAGQAERRRAEILADPKRGITSLSQREQEQAKNIAKITKKDPYDTLTEKEKIDAGYPEDKGIIDKGKETLVDWWSKISPTMALGKGVGALLDNFFKNPTVAQLRDPNFLAIMKQALGENTDKFVKDYKDTIAEAFKGDSSEEDFLRALESAESPQGSEAQRRIAPWDYYDKDLYYDKVFPGPAGMMQSEYDLAMQDYPKFLSAMGLSPISSRFGNTMGNLEDIASIPLDSIPYDERGQEFRKQVIEAREAVSRSRQEDRQRSGGGVGIPMGSSLGVGEETTTPFTYEQLLQQYGRPNLIPENLLALVEQPEVAQVTTTPATATTMPAATTFAASPFDYSQWPQYMQQGIASPNLNPWYNTLQNYYGVV